VKLLNGRRSGFTALWKGGLVGKNPRNFFLREFFLLHRRGTGIDRPLHAESRSFPVLDRGRQ